MVMRAARFTASLAAGLALFSGCAKVLGIGDPIVVAANDAGDDACDDGGLDAVADAREVSTSDAADAADAARPLPPSCAPGGAGIADCGPGGAESCCASTSIAGGTFFRGYDNVTYTDKSYPAKVSGLRLDKYEVTVGRFRQFVGAVVGGWKPPAGAGKHAHLSGGAGLNGGTEPGWDAADNVNLAATSVDWDANLACSPQFATWTPSAGPGEKRPITCISWYEACAFCIWDGAFLPTEAEWNYAASGGSEQRAYPWSAPPVSTTIDCTYANYDPVSACVMAGPNDVGSESPKGDGKWGQADLAGNVYEWALDWFEFPYATPCEDCADLTPASIRVNRSGGARDGAQQLFSSARAGTDPAHRDGLTGARCARIP